MREVTAVNFRSKAFKAWAEGKKIGLCYVGGTSIDVEFGKLLSEGSFEGKDGKSYDIQRFDGSNWVKKVEAFEGENMEQFKEWAKGKLISWDSWEGKAIGFVEAIAGAENRFLGDDGSAWMIGLRTGFWYIVGDMPKRDRYAGPARYEEFKEWAGNDPICWSGWPFQELHQVVSGNGNRVILKDKGEYTISTQRGIYWYKIPKAEIKEAKEHDWTQVAKAWAKIFGAEIQPRQVPLALMVLSIFRESKVPDVRNLQKISHLIKTMEAS